MMIKVLINGLFQNRISKRYSKILLGSFQARNARFFFLGSGTLSSFEEKTRNIFLSTFIQNDQTSVSFHIFFHPHKKFLSQFEKLQNFLSDFHFGGERFRRKLLLLKVCTISRVNTVMSDRLALEVNKI